MPSGSSYPNDDPFTSAQPLSSQPAVTNIQRAAFNPDLRVQSSGAVETNKSTGKRPHANIAEHNGGLDSLSDTKRMKSVEGSHPLAGKEPTKSQQRIKAVFNSTKHMRRSAEVSTHQIATGAVSCGDQTSLTRRQARPKSKKERAARALRLSQIGNQDDIYDYIVHLEHSVAEQEQSHKNDLDQAHMDAVMDVMKRNDEMRKLVDYNKRLAHSLYDMTARYDEVEAQSTKNNQLHHTRIERMITAHKHEVEAYKQDIEHMQVKCSMLDDDLDELKQMASEEARAREEAKSREGISGLPPAYGSLEEEDELQSCTSILDDGGVFHIANLKRMMRRNMRSALLRAHEKAASIRATIQNGDTRDADHIVVGSGLAVLNMCCRNLSTALDAVGEVKTLKTAKGTDGFRVLSQEPSRVSFTADRVAKLIFELCWRVVSAHDLRPVQISLTSSQKMKLAIYLQNIDTVLERAIKLSFVSSTSISAPDLLGELQLSLTQLSVLQDSFAAMHLALNKIIFDKTWQWLSEQVESQRQLVAREGTSPLRTSTIAADEKGAKSAACHSNRI